MKNLIITILVIILITGGVYIYKQNAARNVDVTVNTEVETTNTATSTDETTENVVEDKTKTVIGDSVEEQPITAYHYGEGEKEVLFIGGIHGGYSWNTSLVAYELMDYLKDKPEALPSNVKVTVIPVLNPDGLKKVTGSGERFDASDITKTLAETVPGRFNANNVDLNRNFDCDWQAESKWQSKTVSGGSKAFSEPESLAIKNYVEKNKPAGVVVYYSSAGGVYASNCHGGVSTETKALLSAYSKASGYKAFETFNYYEISGDMANWLAKVNVPAVSVLLTTHTSTDWNKNKAGIDAVLNYFSN